MTLIEVFIVRPFTLEKGFIFTLAISYFVINIRDWQIYIPSNLHSITTALSPEFYAHYNITKSEKRVAHALLKGMSNKEMAYTFEVAENTIKNQIYSIYRKLVVQSRVEFVNKVRNAQLGQFSKNLL